MYLPIMLVYGPNGSGKTRTIEEYCAQNFLHFCKVDKCIGFILT
jgi:hypothetical protein